MGLGALFGLGQKPAPVAKSLTAAPMPSSVAAPPNVAMSGASAALAAFAAAQKARKKAAGGSTPSVPAPTGTILTSTAAPKTLLGY
jgi:hypothetical protein